MVIYHLTYFYIFKDIFLKNIFNNIVKIFIKKYHLNKYSFYRYIILIKPFLYIFITRYFFINLKILFFCVLFITNHILFIFLMMTFITKLTIYTIYARYTILTIIMAIFAINILYIFIRNIT